MRSNPLLHRSIGERAFDRCLLPLPVMFLLLVSGGVMWSPMISFEVGLLFACYWVWALCGVVRGWSDPVVRIQRFCSVMLLLVQLSMVGSLLSVPFVLRANFRWIGLLG